MDVITAFLLGKLDGEIFMMQPEGFERQGLKAKMVCRLLRSLYGLKQASRVWNMQLHEFRIKIGFRRSNADTCLYVNVGISIFIAIWVDDILIAGKDARNIAKVKKQLAGEFSMKDLGPIRHFLGMRVTRTDGNISIDQSTYIKDILARFGMEDSKPVSTPLATGTKLTKNDANSAKNEIQPLYQSIVGSLMYAMLCTKPDVAYTVQQLSQFASNPSSLHLQAAKRVLRYLQGTQESYLTYRRDNGGTGTIQSYSDADFAAGEYRKSISGYIFILVGSPISWQAKKQSTIALSTAEAEYAALMHAAKEVIWLQNLLKDLGMTKYAPKVINVDNQGTIALAENPIHHARTKHLDVQLQFVRDSIENGIIELRYCPTDVMLADIMTKALTKEKHAAVCRMIGMANTSPSPFEVKS